MKNSYNSRQRKIYSDYSEYSTERLIEAINSEKYVSSVLEIIRDILEERNANQQMSIPIKVEKNINDKENKNGKKLDSRSITLLFIASIFVYILLVFIIPFNGGTVFDRRNLKRYENSIINKKYEKIQIYVKCRDSYNVEDATYEAEELGANSYDVCLMLEKHGLFTNEYIKHVNTNLKSNKIDKILVKSQIAACDLIINNMTAKDLAKLTPYWVSGSIKRRWYHYFLF